MNALLSRLLGDCTAAGALGSLVAAWVSVAFISEFPLGGDIVLALA